MSDIFLVTPPVAEPVTVDEMLVQLGITPASSGALSTVTKSIEDYLYAAREVCEKYLRCRLITQTWQYNLDGWPQVHSEYKGHMRGTIYLPRVPFQSVTSFQYVDTDGNVQTLPVDTSYGNDVTGPTYAYQVTLGSDVQPARLFHAWPRPWPPVRWVPASVMIQFKCGYGGPVTASMTESSAVLSGPVFNPGDVGQSVVVPNVGSGKGTLKASISSVDSNGQATLSSVAATSVSSVTCWVGRPVPHTVRQAIKFLCRWYYEQGSVVDQAEPRVVRNLLDLSRNLVS